MYARSQTYLFKTTPFTALHTYCYVCIYNIYIAYIHVCHFLHSHGLQGFFSKLLSETKYCACFIKIAIRVTILLLFTRGQGEKKFYLLCPCRVLFFHFYCVSIFIEHKDEIYEEDLKEGWTFLGRKKVQIVFIVVLVVFLFKWGVPVCHLYCNTVTLVQTNPLKFHAWEASEAKFSRNSPELVHAMGSYKHASRHVDVWRVFGNSNQFNLWGPSHLYVHHLMTWPLQALRLEVMGGVRVFEFQQLQPAWQAQRGGGRGREREENAKWKIPLPFLPPADPLPLSNSNACYLG